MTSTTGKSKSPSPKGLIGRLFVIWRAKEPGIPHRPEFQGIVREALGPHHYLVQLFSAIDGSPTELFVASIHDMASRGPGSREAGAWDFFEDADHMEFWFKHRCPSLRDVINAGSAG